MSVLFSTFLGMLVVPHPAGAAHSLGTGNEGLLGGDLTDPDDTVVPAVENMGSDLPEEDLKPPNATWLTMKCAPANGPDMIPHQRHPYQSWQNSPACAIFLNRPANMKWYVGFKDGGYGGPTREAPYFAAIELKDAFFLTHFTVTPSPEMPGRDPMSWAIQGSNTGEDGDWADIYVCDATDRNGTPFKENSRCETFLFTSFTSDDMAQVVRPEDAKKIEAKLAGRTIKMANFTRPTKTYNWFRIVVYSCFNPNSTYVEDFNFPPGFSLSQLELFGVPGPREPEVPWAVRAAEIAKAKAAARETRAEEALALREAAEAQRAIAEKADQEAKAAEEAILAVGRKKAREADMAKKAEEAKAARDAIKPPVYDAPFMITYWCGPSKAETTLERYKEIAECGFNVAFPAIDNLWEPADEAQAEHNRKYLDLCQQVGLKALVWDGHMRQPEGWKPPTAEEIPAIEKAMDGIIARYASHPALLGYVVHDEPGREQFTRIGVINQYLLKKDPKHLPYINLLPNYAGPEDSEWRGRAYERSVARFIDSVKPALLSWDHYRQMFENGDERYYWDNLEIVRRTCLKAKVPYIQIIVSIKHMGYRECSEADLRWQVWTSLAYGSRGITYFTYCHVPGMAWGDAPGLLTKDGKRDAKWEYVKKINQRIAKLGPTLVKLTSTGVYCTSPRPIGTQRLAADAPVKKAEGGALVIGFFEDAAGKVYILPVNRSFKDTFTARLTLDDKFVSAEEISQQTGQPLAGTNVAQKPLEMSLEPGEGKLFLLK